MEKSKEAVSVCRISESTVTLNENVAGETLDCASQGEIEGFGGEDTGGCSGKDVMVEVLGSDLYIDGVCTRGNETELNDDVACGGSVEVDKDVQPSGGVFGVGNEAEAGFEGSQVKQSLEAKGENPTAHLDDTVADREEVLMGTLKDCRPERGEAPVASYEIDVANMQRAPVLDNGAEKEVGIGVSESVTVVNSTPEETEVSTVKDAGLERINAQEAGARDEKLTNTFNNALGGLTTVSSSDVENVHSDSVEKGNQPQNHGATEGGNDLTLKPLDEQKKIANGEGGKILEKEAYVHQKDESVKTDATDEKLHSAGEQPMDIDKFGENSNSPPKEVVAKAEVSVDKNILNSDQKCFTLEKCIERKMIPDTLQVSSDTGQEVEDDKHFHAEDFTSFGREQNSVNHETAGASSNREGKANSNNEVQRCALYEQPQNEQCLEMDVGGDLDLVDSGSRKHEKLIEIVLDAENVSSSKGKEEEVEDQSASINRGSPSANVQGTSVSSGVAENNLEANIISRSVEDNQTADVGISELVDSLGEKEMEIEEFNNASHHKSMDEKVIKHTAVKPGSSGKCYQAHYRLPPEMEGEFSVSDMVWGKVRSHPWWPGQIFDPSDSSEKAMKHYKKDCFLVAYFGDRTFAWNEATQLKSFRAHFSSIEKHSNSESFQNAVECALDEISRRVEFGLACSCIPKDTYDEIKFQTVENTGIREEISLRYGMDDSLNAISFSPDNLIDYLKILSQCPAGGFDRLELAIAKAQLLAFYRLKGYSFLPELQHCGGLDNDLDSSIHDAENNLSEDIKHATPVSKNADQASSGHRVLKGQNSSYHKRKHNLKDGMYPKKEKSLSEIFSGTPDSPDGDYWSDEKAIDNLVSPTLSKKRRTVDPYADDSGMQDGRKTISLAKVSSSSKQSFKIGECIRRVASQLTGTPSTAKSSGDRSQKPDESTDVVSGDVSDVPVQNLEEAQRSSLIVPTEYSSLNDLLSLLHGVAQDPLENCSFLSVIVSFFSDFRNSIVVGNYSGREITPTNKVGTKRKKLPVAGSPKTFEFEDMSDTYWTDRVIQNGSEEQPPKRGRKRDNQPVPTDPEKPVQVSRRTYSRKRYSDSINVEASEKPSGYIDERSPAELVMNFAELDSVPSEANLNKMFRRFGPLKESETEVDTMSSRARVVFKKCADAEVAFNSAKKFNIFGPILVNYQLNYTPSALFKASTVATTHDQEMHLDLSNFEVNMV